jgi:DNA-binding LacI/PurR family transcriptional regulator
MRQLHYVPPAKRRGPKPKASGINTGNIGLLFVGEKPTLATSPVMARVLHAAQEELAVNGLNLMVGQINTAGGLPPNVTNGQIDGLLMHGLPPSTEIRMQLSRYSACVWLLSQRRQRGYWGDRVSPDNFKVGAIAASYLADRGHQRIAAISCDPSHLGFATRLQGFEATAGEEGVEFETLADREGKAIEIDQSNPSDARFDGLVDQLLAMKDRMPTGLFIPRDTLTIRMYRILRKRGLEPGHDIDIISCDNIPALDGLDPRPASIDVRPEEIGRRAVEQLLWQINSRQVPMNVTSMVEPALVSGEQTELASA